MRLALLLVLLVFGILLVGCSAAEDANLKQRQDLPPPPPAFSAGDVGEVLGYYDKQEIG